MMGSTLKISLESLLLVRMRKSGRSAPASPKGSIGEN